MQKQEQILEKSWAIKDLGSKAIEKCQVPFTEDVCGIKRYKESIERLQIVHVLGCDILRSWCQLAACHVPRL